MLEFVFERYNYWMIIFLMMIGLYVTFQAGNLIKRMIGLSVFQTSVFLFYITLGKIAGGTAPILVGKDAKKAYKDGAHGGDGAHGSAYGAASHSESAPQTEPAPVDQGPEQQALTGEPLPEQTENTENAVTEAVDDAFASVEDVIAEIEAETTAPVYEVAAIPEPDVSLPQSKTDALGRPFVEAFVDRNDPTAGLPALETVYSNPLPHVLILTAIVVGVAVLAVGLALIVRIREAYGTIEMDEIRDADMKTAAAEDAAEPA